jgi:hypothetical protein
VLRDRAAVVAKTDQVWSTVTANLATPFVRNPRGLLLCVLAHICEGDDARAAELERDTTRIGGAGYESYLSGAAAQNRD